MSKEREWGKRNALYTHTSIVLMCKQVASTYIYIYIKGQCSGCLISHYGTPLAQWEHQMTHLRKPVGATWFSSSIGEILYTVGPRLSESPLTEPSIIQTPQSIKNF